MARDGALYHAFNGSKLEYSTTQTGTYTRIYGLSNIPDIGGEPNKIDTTDLDNLKYETNILGLQPAPEMTFEFNMEDPSAEANIKLVSDMEDSGENYYFKLTYSNGIIIEFDSKVRTTLVGGSSSDLLKFQLHLSPNSEIERTIPVDTSV